MFKSLVRIVFIVGFIWQGLVANGLNKYSDYPDWVFNIPQDKNKVYAIGSIQTKINSDDAIVRNKIYKKFQHGSVYSVFKDNKTVSKKELKEIAYYRAYLELMKSYNLSITYKGRYYKVNNKLGMTKNTTQLTKLYDIKTKKEKEFLSKDGNYFILLSTKIVYAKSNSKDVAKILTKSENGKFFYKQLFNTQEYGSNTKFTIKNNTQHGSQLPMYFSKYMMRSDYKIGTVDLMESQNFYIKYEQAILEARIQFIQNQTQKLNYTNIVHTYIDKNGVMHVVIKLNEDMKHRIEEQKREQKKKEEELKKERKKFKLKPFLQTGHSNTVIKMYISKDDKYMISKERDGIWILWDFELRKKIKEDKSLYELEKYFKKGYFISNKYIQNASIMDKYENFDKNIKHQIIIESKQYIISGGSDNIINIWDTNTKKLKHSFKAHKLGIHSFAISNDNKYLVSSSYKTIKKWDIKTGEFLGKFGVSIANPRLSRFTKYKRNYTDWNSLDNKNTIQSNKFISYNFDLDKYYIWNLDNFSVEKINDIEDYNNIDYAGNSIDIKKEKDVKYSTIKAEGKTISTFKSYKTGGYDDTKYFTGHEGNVNYLLYWKKKNMFFSSSEKGVIKLWDIKSQKKILTMAVFNDDEWVVMTPQGYFNASKNGAKHISIKTDLVKVASIDAFYKKFYRPDLVKLALQGVEIKLDESFSDIIKNKPAPKLSFIDTKESYIKTDKSEYTLKIGAKDTGGGIGRIRVYINDSLVNTSDRGFLLKRKGYDKTYKFNIALSEGENKIKVLAWNKDESMQTNPLELTIVSDAKLKAPNLYALIVGIDKFENDELNLNYAVADAKLLDGAIKSNSKALFKNIYIKSLTSKDETTKENIQKVFKELSKKMKPNDYFIFYISSHGEVEKEKFYLITSNVLFLDEIKDTAISDNNLIELIGNIPTKNKIVFFDTCYAGDMGAKMASALTKKSIVSNRGLSQKGAIDLLNMESGASIFSASSSTQQALEGYKGQGLYTYFLVDGLKGKADNDKDGFVDLSELNRYIKRSVYKTSKDKFKRAQIPYSNLGIDVPISKVK